MTTRRAGVSTKLAFGHPCPGGRRQLAVRVPSETFLELRDRAVKENRSMQSILLQYVKAGLKVAQRWDQVHAPKTPTEA